MKTIPELQQELQAAQAASLNSIFEAHRASIGLTLDLTERENNLLSKEQQQRAFENAREEAHRDAVLEAKQQFLAAERLYYEQEQARALEIMQTIFPSARFLDAKDLASLLTMEGSTLISVLEAALSVDSPTAEHVLFAAFNRADEAAQRVEEIWRAEVPDGADQLSMLGELSMLKGNKDLEDRLREAAERFEAVKPSPRTPDSLMPTTVA